MKDSFAILNYEEREYAIKCANPQQLSTTVGILGRLIGLSREFNDVITPVPTSIVDVGANVGSYSLMLNYSFPEAKIVAIEPSSHNMPYLTYNCSNSKNIEIMKLALGSKRRKAEIALPSSEQKVPHNDYPTSHTGCLSLYGDTDYLREEVDVFPLDELDIQRPIGFIKIDTEGHELHVLEGAKKTIEEDKPTMLIEIHEPNLEMAGITRWEVMRKLAGFGYWADWVYGNDYLFRYVGLDYFFDKLDYKFMEGKKRGLFE